MHLKNKPQFFILKIPTTSTKTKSYQTEKESKSTKDTQGNFFNPSLIIEKRDTMNNLELNIEGEVTQVMLNRPEKKNALNEDLLKELRKASRKVNEKPQVTVLKGAGDTFCAGLDRNLLSNLASSNMKRHEKMIELVQEIFQNFRNLEFPVIAAIDGYALGAGIQLALSADVRLAAPGTIFSVKEPEFGIIPDMGAFHVLPRLVGDGTARDMIYTAREIETEEAKQIGLVDRIYDNLEKSTEEYVKKLTSASPIALKESKKLSEKSWESNLKKSLKDSKESQLKCIKK